ncbi:MAG: hypothetical protein R2932_15250 [Caldilineaceae bacterium]
MHQKFGNILFASLTIVVGISCAGCSSVLQATAHTGAALQRATNPDTVSSTSPIAPVQAPPVDGKASQLLTFLHFVPNQSAYREWLTYGDAEAWYTNWAIPRLQTLDELDTLEESARNRWLFTMATQTTPPRALGLQYMMQEDLREIYGFGFFDTLRYMEAGQPPDLITVVEVDANFAQIDERLLELGYVVTERGEVAPELEATLYELGDDYSINLQAPARAGQLGELNRIALIYHPASGKRYIILGRATAVVEAALAPWRRSATALADDPTYRAAVKAIFDPHLAQTGELVGLIFLGEPNFSDPVALMLGARATPEQIARLRAQLADRPKLPPIRLAAFATRHAPGATLLVLALVLPRGAPTEKVAALLSERLENYVSAVHSPTARRILGCRGCIPT